VILLNERTVTNRKGAARATEAFTRS
jgi:hypothetical protein